MIIFLLFFDSSDEVQGGENYFLRTVRSFDSFERTKVFDGLVMAFRCGLDVFIWAWDCCGRQNDAASMMFCGGWR